jgi:hypothetical protein
VAVTFIAFGEHVVNETVAEELGTVVGVVDRFRRDSEVQVFQLILTLIKLVAIALEIYNQIKLLYFEVCKKN